MTLLSRQLILDTQYFVDRSLHFEHVELVALAGIVKQGLAYVYLTDITEREIRKKITDEVKAAYVKLGTSDVRLLKNLPAFHQYLKEYPEKQAVAFFEAQFEAFKKECEVRIIPSNTVNLLAVFDDYCRGLAPFNVAKKKKEEFPDAFALAAVNHWALKGEYRAYFISKDDDWKLFAQKKHPTTKEPYFECLEEMSQFTDLIYRTEERLKDVTAFSDALVEERMDEIIKEVIAAIQNTGFNSDTTEEVDVYEAFILDAKLENKEILQCERDGAVYDMEFEITGVVGYDVTSFEKAVWDREDSIWLGTEQYTYHQYQNFTVGVEVVIGFEDGLETNFLVAAVHVPDLISIPYDNDGWEVGEVVNVEQWNNKIPVELHGVAEGKISPDGSGMTRYENFEAAEAAFPGLNIYEPTEEFTQALGKKFDTLLRFETRKLADQAKDIV